MRNQRAIASIAILRDAAISEDDLWVRYVELGGLGTPGEMMSYLQSGAVTNAHDYDVMVHALNERLAELGRLERVEYATVGRRTISPAKTVARDEHQLMLLGSFGLHCGSTTVRIPLNSQRLVCYLALHDGLLLRQHVAGSLWGDTTEQHASGSLRSALWRLGHLAGPMIEATGSHLRLLPAVAVDLHASEALARRILDPSSALDEADLSDSLLAEDLLPDWTEDWVLVRRGYHTQLRLRALEALCLRLSEMGRCGAAVQAATLAVAGEPLRESAQRALIGAYFADGNLGGAKRQYAAFRELLLDELGLEPSAAMQLLMKSAA